MPRLPKASRDNFGEELRALFDEVSGGPPGAGAGPMSILNHSPEMARRTAPLFNYVRNESSLPQRIAGVGNAHHGPAPWTARTSGTPMLAWAVNPA